MSVRILLTKDGYIKISKFLEECEKNRVIIIEKIDEARKHGDLSENAEYKAAREEQSINDRKITEISMVKANADILTKHMVGDLQSVKIGAKVFLEASDGAKKNFTMVSHYEADIASGYISIETPIAKNLMHKEVGDIVTVTNKEYEITNISYDHLD
jgi:transcription elongation factor GreA